GGVLSPRRVRCLARTQDGGGAGRPVAGSAHGRSGFHHRGDERVGSRRGGSGAARPEGVAMISGSRERLAFNVGGGMVPSRHVVEAAIARENRPTFATAVYNEPRDWGYAGLLAFTTVLMTRPQDTLPFLNPFHLAELCAIVGIAPMVMHRLTSRQPVFRVTPETTGLLALGAAILFTTPFSIWPGGSFGLFTDSYLKLLVVFVLMMNTLTTPRRIEQITWVIVLCCGFIAGRSVFDYARGVNLVEGNRLAGAIGGIFGNPNDLAMNMV